MFIHTLGARSRDPALREHTQSQKIKTLPFLLVRLEMERLKREKEQIGSQKWMSPVSYRDGARNICMFSTSQRVSFQQERKRHRPIKWAPNKSHSA